VESVDYFDLFQQYKRESDEEWTETTVPGRKRSTVIDNLTNNTAYVFQLLAVNEIGESEWTPQSEPVPTLNEGRFFFKDCVTRENRVFADEWRCFP
jgi:hypothetical protein